MQLPLEQSDCWSSCQSPPPEYSGVPQNSEQSDTKQTLKNKNRFFFISTFSTRSKNVGTYDGIHTSICFIYTVSLLYLTTITLAIQLLPDAVLPVEAVPRLSLSLAIQLLPNAVLPVEAVPRLRLSLATQLLPDESLFCLSCVPAESQPCYSSPTWWKSLMLNPTPSFVSALVLSSLILSWPIL